jgi:hypothetical protein
MTLNIYSVMSAKGIRYYVDYPEGRLHILNERSLVWNLKGVFGISPEDTKGILQELYANGCAKIDLRQVA